MDPAFARAPGPVLRSLFAVHHAWVHVPRVARVSAALARQVGRAASLLDVGAGDGTMALAVGRAALAERIAGVDVKVRRQTAIPVREYDGARLPFDDGAFEAVILSDVLHHAADPKVVLTECLRVARRVVAVKDHFCFGRASHALLYAMDVIGNAGPDVAVRGSYFSPGAWNALVREAGGQVASIEWPLRVHLPPLHWITRDSLQFVAAVTQADGRPSAARAGAT